MERLLVVRSMSECASEVVAGGTNEKHLVLGLSGWDR